MYSCHVSKFSLSRVVLVYIFPQQTVRKVKVK